MAHPRRGQPGVSARYCEACRHERRRYGQLRRWAGERARRPELEPRPCAWVGCHAGADGERAEVPGYRRYCCHAHYAADQRGPRPSQRRGREVRCGCRAARHAHPKGVCGAPLGYLRLSRVRRARRHYCATCRRDLPWHWGRRTGPPAFCRHCGGPVSSARTTLCRECYLGSPRFPYRHQFDKQVAELSTVGRSQRQIAAILRSPARARAGSSGGWRCRLSRARRSEQLIRGSGLSRGSTTTSAEKSPPAPPVGRPTEPICVSATTAAELASAALDGHSHSPRSRLPTSLSGGPRSRSCMGRRPDMPLTGGVAKNPVSRAEPRGGQAMHDAGLYAGHSGHRRESGDRRSRWSPPALSVFCWSAPRAAATQRSPQDLPQMASSRLG